MRLLTLLGLLIFGATLAAMHSVAAFAVVLSLAANAGPEADAATTADPDVNEALDVAQAAPADADVGLAQLVVRPIELTIARPHAEDLVVFETPWWVVLYWAGGLGAIALATLLCALGVWGLGGRAKAAMPRAQPPPAPASTPSATGSPRLGQH